MKFSKIITGCALMVLSCGTTEAARITVTAMVPQIFELLNGVTVEHGLDKNIVNLLKADGALSDEDDRIITFMPTKNGRARVKVSSLNGSGENCRVRCNGADHEYVAYTVKIQGNEAPLQHETPSDAIDFQKGVGFSLVFNAGATAFIESGKTYEDTLTVTFEAPEQ